MRPEAREALWRAREALAGLALLLLALWLGLTAFGLLRWVAGGLGLLGLALAWTGVQRWRFSPQGRGPGVVEVDERRLVYWGPLSGGAMDLDDLLRLEFDPTGRPGHWVMTSLRGETLAVPANAEGAEGLLDLFSALPGLRAEALVAAVGTREPVVVWQKANVLAFPGAERGRLN